jgi:uncharacterized protein YbaP (TraB family)
MIGARILLFLLAVLVCGIARADAPPVQDWSKTIETVIVTAHKPGPLMWRITKGDSTVILLPVVEPVPEKLDWNSAGVSEALKGARQLLLQPHASVGLAEGLWFMAWNSSSVLLPSETPMESTLPEGLRKRFAATRDSVHQDADRYARLRVPLAGLRLEGDFLEASKLTQEEPVDTIRHIARGWGVSSKPIAEYEAIPMLKQLPAMPAEANAACMKASLDDIDALRAHAVPTAQAWAKGDLDTIENNYSEQHFESCIQAMPSFAALFERGVTDSMKAVNGALAKPGKTVMIVSMGAMLRKNGLLERLEAQGLDFEEF